jgi:hypothetical protein
MLQQQRKNHHWLLLLLAVLVTQQCRFLQGLGREYHRALQEGQLPQLLHLLLRRRMYFCFCFWCMRAPPALLLQQRQQQQMMLAGLGAACHVFAAAAVELLAVLVIAEASDWQTR